MRVWENSFNDQICLCWKRILSKVLSCKFIVTLSISPGLPRMVGLPLPCLLLLLLLAQHHLLGLLGHHGLLGDDELMALPVILDDVYRAGTKMQC